MLKHNRKIKLIVILTLSVTLMAAGILALTDPELPRSFIGAGGQSAGDGYALTGVSGQYEAGGVLTGENYALLGGFWGRGVPSPGLVAVFLPLIQR